MRIEDKVTAGFMPRFAAWCIDRLLLGLVLVWVKLPALVQSISGEGILNDPLLFTHTLRDVLCWVITAAYFVLLTGCNGATLGKRAMKLRVVTADGEKPSFFCILYRETVGRFLSSLLCIGYLLMLGDAQHRTLHDRICDTLVIYCDPVRRAQPVYPQRTLTVVPVQDPEKEWYKPYKM